MIVYYCGTRMPWYIPGMDSNQTVYLDPATFDPKMLPKGKIEQGRDAIPMVVIPNVPKRISIRKDGYIELILSRYYNKEAHQSRNKKVIIGQDISHILLGMMNPNDNYYSLFDGTGRLYNDQMKGNKKTEVSDEGIEGIYEEPAEEETAESEEKKPEKQPPEKQQPEGSDEKPQPEEPDSRQAESKTMKEKTGKTEQPQSQPITEDALAAREKAVREKEARLAERIQELLEISQQLSEAQEQQMMEQNEALRDHVYLLDKILRDFIDTIEHQVKRKPDAYMSLKQIRTINEILRELKDILTDSEAGDFLHLAEEPDSEHDNPGTTYGEMNLLLNIYTVTTNTFSYGCLRKKKVQKA